MIQAIQKKLSNRKGFTLIELIVVIVILGILAAILVPTFSGYVTRAKRGSDEVIIGSVKTVLAVALAEGKITEASITLNNTGVVAASSSVGTGSTHTVATLTSEINKAVPDTKLTGYTSATIAISSAGIISINKTE